MFLWCLHDTASLFWLSHSCGKVIEVYILDCVYKEAYQRLFNDRYDASGFKNMLLSTFFVSGPGNSYGKYSLQNVNFNL